ncbi:star [Acrasis kona]|uniref:Star n=1 Tax=Acrasis kona TaxID=1008807 RepID=A0AAW2YKM6_9EUKA
MSRKLTRMNRQPCLSTPTDDLNTSRSFDIQEVLSIKLLRDGLQSFSYKDDFSSPIHIYESIEEFKELPTGVKVVAQSILQLYLKPNINTLFQESDVSGIEKIISEDQNIPLTLFDQVQPIILSQIECDFQRFMCSKDFDPCMLFLTTQSASPTTKKEVAEKDEVDKNLGVLYDPNLIQVTQKDFDRVTCDIKDQDMWKSVYNSKERTVFVSKNPFYNGKKGLKKMKETGVIPFSVDECFNTYIDNACITKVEKEIKKITEIDYVESTSHALTVLRFQYKLPFFLSNRDFCLIHSAKRYGDGYIMIRKSVNHPDCPTHKNYIRAVATGGIVFEKIDEHTTRYTQTYYADYSGWLTASVFNKIVESRDNTWHDAMIKCCSLRRLEGSGRPILSNRIADTLRYNDRMTRPQCAI